MPGTTTVTRLRIFVHPDGPGGLETRLPVEPVLFGRDTVVLPEIPRATLKDMQDNGFTLVIRPDRPTPGRPVERLRAAEVRVYWPEDDVEPAAGVTLERPSRYGFAEPQHTHGGQEACTLCKTFATPGGDRRKALVELAEEAADEAGHGAGHGAGHEAGHGAGHEAGHGAADEAARDTAAAAPGLALGLAAGLASGAASGAAAGAGPGAAHEPSGGNRPRWLVEFNPCKVVPWC
jgi:hypothetical protein